MDRPGKVRLDVGANFFGYIAPRHGRDRNGAAIWHVADKVKIDDKNRRKRFPVRADRPGKTSPRPAPARCTKLYNLCFVQTPFTQKLSSGRL